MSKKSRFTLAIIQLEDAHILMINRLKKPYIGLWNGIGGKIEPTETSEEGMQREITEETGLDSGAYQLFFAGVLDWYVDGKFHDSIDLYLAKVASRSAISLPKEVREGLLVARSIKWIEQEGNNGVVPDFKLVVRPVIEGQIQHYRSEFEGEDMISLTSAPYEKE